MARARFGPVTGLHQVVESLATFLQAIPSKIAQLLKMVLPRQFLVRSRTAITSNVARSATVSRPGLRFASTAPATIADASFWRSLVPKPLRREKRLSLKGLLSREWNPATFFIIIFLLIGSMSIQMIALRNSFDRYMRQSEVRIGLLREVVEKIQNGEKVDVEKVLGTGDLKKEADWDEVLQAIERDEMQKKPSKQDKSKKPDPLPKPDVKVEPVNPQLQEPAVSASKPKTGSLGNFF
ncbi:hypothetical protein HJFPF1_03561 [Paramyrothecium foliicola]|nr:hypothetical protein HJFPF1_03561 [Paramyrothecium foliicola]